MFKYTKMLCGMQRGTSNRIANFMPKPIFGPNITQKMVFTVILIVMVITGQACILASVYGIFQVVILIVTRATTFSMMKVMIMLNSARLQDTLLVAY